MGILISYCFCPKTLPNPFDCLMMMCVKWSVWMANSVSPDQTAPMGAGWSGYTQFDHAYLSDYSGWIWYYYFIVHNQIKSKYRFFFFICLKHVHGTLRILEPGHKDFSTFHIFEQWRLRHACLCKFTDLPEPWLFSYRMCWGKWTRTKI